MAAPVNVTDVKATSPEQCPASESWFRYHPGHQTKLDSRNPLTRVTGYKDPGQDPIGYRVWLAGFEQAVMEAP
jgi:hypothetical protein